VAKIVRHYTYEYYWKTENAKDLRQCLLILLEKADSGKVKYSGTEENNQNYLSYVVVERS
jgi:hypothetical protein